MKRSDMIKRMSEILKSYADQDVVITYPQMAEYLLSQMENMGMSPPPVEPLLRIKFVKFDGDYITNIREVNKLIKNYKWEAEIIKLFK